MLKSGWYGIKDGDRRGLALYMRHYSSSAYANGRRNDPANPARNLFVGPGEKMVLMIPDGRALFVWRKFINRSGQQGVNCAVFRNESNRLSSELILEAEQLAWQRWPTERLYTYVDERKIRSANPGYCFKMAGWQLVRAGNGKPLRTIRKNLLILEKNPDDHLSRLPAPTRHATTPHWQNPIFHSSSNYPEDNQWPTKPNARKRDNRTHPRPPTSRSHRRR